MKQVRKNWVNIHETSLFYTYDNSDSAFVKSLQFSIVVQMEFYEISNMVVNVLAAMQARLPSWWDD